MKCPDRISGENSSPFGGGVIFGDCYYNSCAAYDSTRGVCLKYQPIEPEQQKETIVRLGSGKTKIEKLSQILRTSGLNTVLRECNDSCPSDHGLKDIEGCVGLSKMNEDCLKCWLEEVEE